MLVDNNRKCSKKVFYQDKQLMVIQSKELISSKRWQLVMVDIIVLFLKNILKDINKKMCPFNVYVTKYRNKITHCNKTKFYILNVGFYQPEFSKSWIKLERPILFPQPCCKLYIKNIFHIYFSFIVFSSRLSIIFYLKVNMVFHT